MLPARPHTVSRSATALHVDDVQAAWACRVSRAPRRRRGRPRGERAAAVRPPAPPARACAEAAADSAVTPTYVSTRVTSAMATPSAARGHQRVRAPRQPPGPRGLRTEAPTCGPPPARAAADRTARRTQRCPDRQAGQRHSRLYAAIAARGPSTGSGRADASHSASRSSELNTGSARAPSARCTVTTAMSEVLSRRSPSAPTSDSPSWATSGTNTRAPTSAACTAAADPTASASTSSVSARPSSPAKPGSGTALPVTPRRSRPDAPYVATAFASSSAIARPRWPSAVWIAMTATVPPSETSSCTQGSPGARRTPTISDHSSVRLLR